MGYGSYSHSAHMDLLASRSGASVEQVFTQTACHNLMNPKGLKVREARDSAEHPQSLAIIFALDVTGSMGNIPPQLATKTLPRFMALLEQCKVADPQVLFMAVGDADCDRAPLQVGQFETTAELMDNWLTMSYLEGGGGGNSYESYDLAFYIAAKHTDIDCWNKRRKKGYLFITGDEPYSDVVSRHHIEGLIGNKLDEDIPIAEVVAAAAEMYHLFFLVPDYPRREGCEKVWRELLGDHVICMQAPEHTSIVAAVIVALTEGLVTSIDGLINVLYAAGYNRDHVGPILQAVQDYADTLDPKAFSDLRSGSAGNPSWWKKLFG